MPADVKKNIEQYLFRLNKEFDNKLVKDQQWPEAKSRKEQYAQMAYFNGHKILAELNPENVRMCRLMWSLARHNEELIIEDLRHPEYDHPYQQWTSAEVDKRLRTGSRYAVFDKQARDSRSGSSISKIEQFLDKAHLENPRLKITALRDDIAEQLGISRRTIERKTKYNPCNK